eukprot:Gb_18934 [translate_table: standard]
MDPRLWEWERGKETLVISEWDLVCANNLKASLLASFFFLGWWLDSGNTSRFMAGQKVHVDDVQFHNICNRISNSVVAQHMDVCSAERRQISMILWSSPYFSIAISDADRRRESTGGQ